MAHYLNPKNAMTLQQVFLEHKHLSMSLINSMLSLEKPIVNIEYQTGQLIPELRDVLRNRIMEASCSDADGHQFIVVMQMFWNMVYKMNVSFKEAKVYMKQLYNTGDFKLPKPVYVLNFVDEKFDDSHQFYNYYKTVINYHTERLIEDFEYLFIELPKFNPSTLSKGRYGLLQELWLRFLNEIDENTKEAPKELLENHDIREALSYLEKNKYSNQQLDTYLQFKIDIWTESAMLRTQS